jgi:hypothetical protein
MSNSLIISPLMMISLEPAESIVSIKKHLMHIGKIKRMVGTNERKFEYGALHEPVNLGTHEPVVMDDKKIFISVERQWIEHVCRRNKILRGLALVKNLMVKM